MERIPARNRSDNLPLVLLLTTLVLIVPCLVAVGLQLSGLVGSPVLLVCVSVVLSVLFSHSISEIWKRRHSGSPFVFEDLMLWGWLRRRRFERLLARHEEFVGPLADATIPPEQRAKELERLARALEARDPRTHGHSKRVARHATSIASAMKLPEEEVARIRTAALLHDVGKIEVAWEILEKPGALTDEEFNAVKKHASIGAKLVEVLGDPQLSEIVRYHHERIDGGGYPEGIAGEEIPLGARIVSVADAFDALTSARSYRQPRSHEEALGVLRSEAGTQLDARVVGVFSGRYSSRRPIALAAVVLGLGRQAGQSLITFGTGASQVAAVGAATVVIGAAPAAQNLDQPSPSGPIREREVRAGGEASVVGSPASEVEMTKRLTPERGAGGPTSRTGRPPDRADKRTEDGAVGGRKPVESEVSEGGSGSEPSDLPGNSGGSGGAGEGGGSAGTGGSGGVSRPVKKVTETVTKPVQQVTQQVTDSIPALPGKDPVSQGVNETVNGVKDTVGNLIGRP